MTEQANRKEFEEDKITTSAVRWNGKHYSPTDDSSYAINIAHAMNLGFAEFKRGRESSDAELAALREELEQVKKERDDLLNALHYASDYLDENKLNSIGHGSKAHNEMRAAIKSAKGEGK